MIKIMITVRNRLEMTKKCLEALIRHSRIPLQIHIYDNLSNYNLKKHFEYAFHLYKNGIVASYNFNSRESTFNAFSKAVSSNQFGYSHQMDPEKEKYDFLLLLDNDIVLVPGWDEFIKNSWREIKKHGLTSIKIIGQGGIKKSKKLEYKISGKDAYVGFLGGSAAWAVKPNFFDEVGFLNIKNLVGFDKKHDQHYWNKLNSASGGREYILGVNYTWAIHCSKYCSSVCNILTRNKNNKKKEELIKFEESEEKLSKISFEEFYKCVSSDKDLAKYW